MNQAIRQAINEVKNEVISPPKVTYHGKVSSYTVGKCRCQLCLEAIRNYKKMYRQRLGIPPKPRANHGTLTKWESGCTCTPCKNAHLKYEKARKNNERVTASSNSGSGKEARPYSPKDTTPQKRPKTANAKEKTNA